MKALSFALSLALGFSVSALAAPNAPVTAEQAQAIVVQAAHRYIARNAPDSGGSVHSPCPTELHADVYTVECLGVARMTIGGGGAFKKKFECDGTFLKGKDGLYTKAGPVSCR